MSEVSVIIKLNDGPVAEVWRDDELLGTVKWDEGSKTLRLTVPRSGKLVPVQIATYDKNIRDFRVADLRETESNMDVRFK